MLKKILLIAIVVLLSISLFGCNKPEETIEESSEEPPENTAVAIVNGTEIMLFDLFKIYRNMNVSYMQRGVDITDDEITAQILEEALNTLISYELLLQNAVKNGYQVSRDEINEQIETYKSEFETEQDFIDSLELQQLTLDSLVERLEKEMLISEYVQDVIGEPQVLEEEIIEMYQQYKEQREDIPEYEEYKWELEQQLRNNKFSQKVNELIEKLKSESTIEIFREETN
ncbi:UNVERIFIED_CONTAM: SurA-like protein [Acetivibrio alkalicellulosi]